MKIKSLALLATFQIGFLMSPGLHAASVTYNQNFTSFTNPVSGTNSISNSSVALSNISTPFSKTSSAISLTQFDPSLGTLTSVQFTLTLTTSQTAGTANIPLLTLLSDININRTITLNVSLPAFSSAVGSSSSTLSESTLLGLLGPINGGLGEGGSFSNAGPTGFNSSAITNPTQLAALTGLGAFSSTLTSDDIYTINKLAGVGTITLAGATSYAGMLSVTYNFTAIPEPSTWSLMGVFLIGFAVFARKKKVVS